MSTKWIVNLVNYYCLNKKKNLQLSDNDFDSVELIQKKNPENFLYFDRESEELAIMTPRQQDLLEMYGHKCVIMDSTHGTNPYKYQLTTITIVDSHK